MANGPIRYSPFATRRLWLRVPCDELHHMGEHVTRLGQVRRVAGMALHGDVFERDLAPGIAIIGDEALRLVFGNWRTRVAIVVQRVALPLEPDRRRQLDLLA